MEISFPAGMFHMFILLAIVTQKRNIFLHVYPKYLLKQKKVFKDGKRTFNIIYFGIKSKRIHTEALI